MLNMEVQVMSIILDDVLVFSCLLPIITISMNNQHLLISAMNWMVIGFLKIWIAHAMPSRD